MNNLIVYYSFTQNNEKLAEHLQKLLKCETIKLETVKKRTGFSIFLDLLFKRTPAVRPIGKSLRDYDHIIFSAPVWAGKIATPLRSFLLDQKNTITSYSFITICGGGNPHQKEKIQEELSSLVQKAPLNVVELWVNDVLAETKAAKSATGFKITSDELEIFEEKIQNFVRQESQVNA